MPADILLFPLYSHSIFKQSLIYRPSPFSLKSTKICWMSLLVDGWADGGKTELGSNHIAETKNVNVGEQGNFEPNQLNTLVVIHANSISLRLFSFLFCGARLVCACRWMFPRSRWSSWVFGESSAFMKDISKSIPTHNSEHWCFVNYMWGHTILGSGWVTLAYSLTTTGDKTEQDLICQHYSLWINCSNSWGTVVHSSIRLFIHNKWAGKRAPLTGADLSKSSVALPVGHRGRSLSEWQLCK